MNKLIIKIVNYLIKCEVVSEDMREIHIYSVEVMLEKLLCYTTLLLLSWINHNILQTVVFIIVFFSLRNWTGGFHAKKYMYCYFGTVAIYFGVSRGMIPVMMTNRHMLLLIVATSIITIFLGAPVNHPNLQLSSEEIQICKKSARKLIIFISITVGVLIKLNIISEYVSYIVAGIGMDAGLLLIAKIFNQEVKNEEYEKKAIKESD